MASWALVASWTLVNPTAVLLLLPTHRPPEGDEASLPPGPASEMVSADGSIGELGPAVLSHRVPRIVGHPQVARGVKGDAVGLSTQQ